MSYRKIFSVINEHTVSTVAARYAISMAAACKAELVLYAAHDNGDNEAERVHTDRHLDHLYTVASALGIPVTTITEIGDISTLLPKRAEVESADLVFYPLTSYKRYGADVQRRIIRQLLRSIKPDLAIMRAINMAKPHPGHILVPLDRVISDNERRLLFISELAKSFHAQVTLYHLTAERDAKGMPGDITRFGKQLEQRQVTVLERSGIGHIGKSIIVEAITRHMDLIVLGASERGVLRRMFFGDPAGDMLHQPPCNTVLFRAAH